MAAEKVQKKRKAQNVEEKPTKKPKKERTTVEPEGVDRDKLKENKTKQKKAVKKDEPEKKITAKVGKKPATKTEKTVVEFSLDTAESSNLGKKTKKSKEGAVPNVTASTSRTVIKQPVESGRKTRKSAVKAAKTDLVDVDEENSADIQQAQESAAEDQEDEELDDQTAALLAGFESSDEEEEEDNNLIASEKGIDTIPTLSLTKQLSQQLKTAASAPASTQSPGVIYVGRIPHGFYEHQMTAYFSQFGDITRLRLSRNRRTGASRHFAFIEFASDEVSKIVANTMDNYLMFGHLLKVRAVPKAQVHEDLFKGAGKRFKKVPWNRIERMRLVGTDREGWKKRVGKEEVRRKNKAQKLKELGYEFEAPVLRDVEDVAMLPPVVDAIMDSTGEQAKAIEPVVEAEIVPSVVENILPQAIEEIVLEKVAASVAKPEEKGKKGKTKKSSKGRKNAVDFM